MICVTGAAGKTGLAVIRAVAASGRPVRALVRRTEQQAAALDAGAHEIHVGDLTNPQTIRALLQGASALYHICPNMHPEEVAIGRLIVEAAQAVALPHLVYHSVLHPGVEAMPHHWHKLRVEELILNAKLPFTILQPTAYLQNLRGTYQQVTTQGVFAQPYPPTSRIALVDLHDVAEVAARVLGDPEHFGAIYELVGTPPFSQHEVATEISRVLGRAVRATEIPLPQWVSNAQQAGLSPYAIDTLQRMFRYYAEHGLVGNRTVLRWLLGREPTTLEAFLQREGENLISRT